MTSGATNKNLCHGLTVIRMAQLPKKWCQMRRLRCRKELCAGKRLNGLNDPMTRHDISSKLRSGLKCLPDLISIDMQKERAVLL
jgi:hypothetical protein